MPENKRRALAVANQYTNKYFIDESMGKLPDEIRKEVLVLVVTVTEEAGGMTALGFEEDGTVYMDSVCDEGDLGYDQVSARLLISEMEHTHVELFEQLSEWYRTVAKHE